MCGAVMERPYEKTRNAGKITADASQEEKGRVQGQAPLCPQPSPGYVPELPRRGPGAHSAQTRSHPAASLVPGQRSGLPAQPGRPGRATRALGPARERTPSGNTARSRVAGVVPPGQFECLPYSCSFKNRLESSVLGITTPGVQGTRAGPKQAGPLMHSEQTGGSPRTQGPASLNTSPSRLQGSAH